MSRSHRWGSSGSDRSRVFRWLSRLLLPFALLVFVALIYWPGLGGGFVFDDYPNIVDNTALRVTNLRGAEWLAAIFSSPASSLQRPLAMLTFAVNHYFTGLDPRPMKMTNLAVHLLNTLLVFGLVRRLFRHSDRVGATGPEHSDRPALFAAAVWALHPINLMAVLFVVQRMESLSHTFVFAALWLYAAGRSRQQHGKSGWPLILGGLIPFTLLGLLAKESAVLTPLYAFCLELCLFRFRGQSNRRDRRIDLLFAATLWLPALLGIIWLSPSVFGPQAYAGRDFSLIERLMTESRVVCDYLYWSILPNLGQLGLYHDDLAISRSLISPISTLASLITIAALVLIAWFTRRRRPMVALGLMWFLAAQLLTATVVPLELMFEHRNYFASLGISLVLADLLLRAREDSRARRAFAFISIALICFYAATTYLRAREWSDPARFAVSEANKHPQSPRASYDLARTLIIMTNYQARSPFVADARRALDHAIRVPGSNVLPDQAALIFAARIGEPINPAWWKDMQEKLRLRPLGPQETNSLAALNHCMVQRNCKFNPQDVLDTYAAALSQGDNPEVMNIYADYAMNVLRDSDLASRLWHEAIRLRPRESQYRINLIKLLIATKRDDEARAQIEALRNLGRWGQSRAAADSLSDRLQRARATPPAPATSPFRKRPAA